MAYDEGLTQRIREMLPSQSEYVEKKMFGGVGFMLQGNMSVGVNKDDLIVRVYPERFEELVGRPHARPFDMTGRPMKGWIMVSAGGHGSDEDLQEWVEEGVEFALSLPPK